jgi:hypothetical protein
MLRPASKRWPGQMARSADRVVCEARKDVEAGRLSTVLLRDQPSEGVSTPARFASNTTSRTRG